MVPKWEMVGIETREGNDVGAKVRNKSCCVTLRQCKIDDQGMNSERKCDKTRERGNDDWNMTGNKMK